MKHAVSILTLLDQVFVENPKECCEDMEDELDLT